MSGTSCDGVDAALVRIRESRRGKGRGTGGEALRPSVETLAALTAPYPRDLRERLLRLPDVDAADLARLSVEVGERLADATLEVLRRARVAPEAVAFVASHGHTAAHVGARGGGRATLQVGDPALVAERTGIETVADFRPRDAAAGGEGAPLVPFADRLLLARPGTVVAAQNLGGIANVTAMGPGPDDLLAFDTGPGMMAIDLAAAAASGGRFRFDPGGRMAREGRVDARLLRDLLAHPFLRRKPPKSTGREEFGARLVAPLLRRRRTRGARVDLVATLTAFTADSVLAAYDAFLPRVDEAVVSGGGARNGTLLARLRAGLAERGGALVRSDARGLDPDFKEAVAFALLGWARRRGIPNTVPSATGARRAVVAGAVWPGR
jgi:anhydro-N-acetylmuramic acid kinase